MTRSSITLEVGGYCIAISGADLKIAFESHAKASEDNGATEQAMEVPADSMPGEASRPSVGGGSDATHPHSAAAPLPASSMPQVTASAATDAPGAPLAFVATHHWYSDDDLIALLKLIRVGASA